MSNSDRARTRDIRLRMAATGQSYNSARRAVDKERARQERAEATNASAATLQDSLSSPMRDYVRERLRRDSDVVRKVNAEEERLEGLGYQLVEAGQVDGHESWEVRDYRTGELLAAGTDGPQGMDEVRDQRGSSWYNHDSIFDVIEESPEIVSDLPAMLQESLDEWASSAADEEVAGFIGWTTADVARYRG